MKIDYSKAIPVTIAAGAFVIIMISGIKYGFRGTALIVGLFVAAGIVIGIDKYVTWKRNHKK